MLVDFNKVFHPEIKWKNKRLTSNSPCNNCEVYKEYHDKALYGNFAERQYVSLLKSCKTCIPQITWQMDCINKLQWYEDNDENLKGKDN